MVVRSLLALACVWSFSAHADLTYVPANLKRETARVVVAIHGCVQSSEAMAMGTGWNEIADRNNLVIFYPQVPAGSSKHDCWTWFGVENQRADSGQLKLVADKIRELKSALGLKQAKVFLSGLSSGAATVAGLMACFPNEFASGAIHSGPSYGLARNPIEALMVLKNGPLKLPRSGPCQPSAYSGSVLVIQGDADKVVNPAHAQRAIEDFVGNVTPVSSQEIAAQEGQLAYTVSDYRSTNGRKGRLVLVKGLEHMWSGYKENLRHKKPAISLPFFSESKPSATNLMWEFFNQP